LSSAVSPLRRILDFYRFLASRIAVFMTVAVIVLAASAAIVYPFWYLATYRIAIFNWLFAAVAACLVSVTIAWRLIGAARDGVPKPRRFASLLRKAALLIGSVAAAYGVFLLWIAGWRVPALAAGIFSALVIGFLAYARR
jgi:hypothetical protein